MRYIIKFSDRNNRSIIDFNLYYQLLIEKCGINLFNFGRICTYYSGSNVISEWWVNCNEEDILSLRLRKELKICLVRDI
jgi:hypothetical protein